VRIVRRKAERAVDARLELLGDHMLESVCLVVHIVDVDAERLRQIELEQPVVADHLDRDPLARLREARPAVRLVIEQAERPELLQHRGSGGRRHALVARDRCDRHPAAALLLQLVDRLQVVLDRLGEGRSVHHLTLVR
jgi:hypothetical protein